MKKYVSILLSGVLALALAACSGGNSSSSSEAETTSPSPSEAASETASEVGSEAPATETATYPDGTMSFYAYGQPQYLQEYFDKWLATNAPNVKAEIVQTKDANDSREKISMTFLSGAMDDLPTWAALDPVSIISLAKGGMVTDMTDYVTPLKADLVDGALNDAILKDRVYGLPESVRPQMLYYNEKIFNDYGVDPAQMTTFDGWIQAGRELKEKSEGKVYLSYVDPGNRTWRYYGRRGMMPQANGRIWDDAGNVVIGSDEGAKLAFSTLDTMHSEELLLKSTILEPPLYDNIRAEEIATFYIGAFWDEFLRINVPETAGQWKVMAAPVFEGIDQGGAPVASYWTFLNNPDDPYTQLAIDLWNAFHFDNEARKEWVTSVESQNGPYANPVTLSLLEDPFWKEPSEFYGGQSFREMEGKCLENSSKNLMITPQDAEADSIISAEIEKYVAGDQTMDEAIANMQTNLEAKIGKAEVE